ncbi:unnamed protein product [Rotaria magnacalcarata]|uniref:Uncharacterized protein n=2 Tax=Rotaria magnacalcarata TaxID=392030 RepID=A0A816TJN3_9BILA|nr:unnamed protein product [Rotaria magnacalcarata]
MGLNEFHVRLSDLLCDADENCDDKIDILGMTTIIEDLSKQDEHCDFIFNEPDENEINQRMREFHKKVSEIILQDIKIDKEMYNPGRRKRSVNGRKRCKYDRMFYRVR